MRGLGLRVGTNVAALVVFTVAIIALALATFAGGLLFDDAYQVSVVVPDAGGVLPRQQVTVMGRAVGTVQSSDLVADGVRLTFAVQPQFPVPATADVQIVRRSPIGEQAVELTPVPAQGWAAAAPDAQLTVRNATSSVTVQRLLSDTATLFTSINPDHTATIVHELAVALDGRSEIIRQLTDANLDVSRTLLNGQDQFRRVLDSSEPLLETLDQQTANLRRIFGNGADLAEVLAADRPDLERLLAAGPDLFAQTEALIVNVRPNAECLVDDLLAVNDLLLGPTTATGAPARFYDTKLDEVQMAIDKHPFFFQLGLPLVIQPDPTTGLGWTRVKFELDKLGSGQRYATKRPTPATRPGAACQTAAWGPGVNAVRQPGTAERGLDPASPGIEYAPLVQGAGTRTVAGPPVPEAAPVEDRAPLPATGGGLTLLAISAAAASLAIRKRR